MNLRRPAFRLQIINQNFPKFVKLAAVYGELNMVENIEDNITASPALPGLVTANGEVTTLTDFSPVSK